ncbi:phosphoadenylyl-sulfate reductase [Compostibacter hankyongensis]|uniref:Adenosine 5'-phosphosulfate reductase n=1 Tax=Compostibacter hankyongensis TaxID=1007089 RepID=A0ABP8FWX8_9BACT
MSELKDILEGTTLEEGLRRVAAAYPGQVVFSTSFGQEDQVIADAIWRHDIPVRVFTLDTGRLFEETYELMDLTRARYKKPFEVYFPRPEDVEQYVEEHGFNGFYDSVENRKACCHIRKVLPLRRALQGARIWITGLRAEQSDNRKDTPLLEWDEQYQLYKYNPLIGWEYADVLSYLKDYQVPYNRLHDKGFVSIGCAPCTRAVLTGEHPRAGRWWWEQSQKECGLHTHS